MTLKQSCEAFTDEHQQDLSEIMYRETYSKSAEEILRGFCSSESVLKIAPTPTAKRRRAGATGKRARGKGRGSAHAVGSADVPSMDDMLRKYDVDGAISNLIEMERERPEEMLEAEQLEQVYA